MFGFFYRLGFGSPLLSPVKLQLEGHSMAFIICIYYINWSALKGFPSLRKTVSPHGKNCDKFSCVFEIL